MANPSTSTSTDDPFDSLLTLEDTLYTSAYTLGTHDGARAGRIEGRLFGLEKGFEKFAALGSLHGRAVVWSAQVAPHSTSTQLQSDQTSQSIQEGQPDQPTLPQPDSATHEAVQQTHHITNKAAPQPHISLPPLNINGNERLKKHITTLTFLTDPQTFSTLNTEDAVADFDDRLKRAGAKAKIIERSVSSPLPSSKPTSPSISNTTSSAPKAASSLRSETTSSSKDGSSSQPTHERHASPIHTQRRSVKLSDGGGGSKKKGDDSMEDFSGSRFLR